MADFYFWTPAGGGNLDDLSSWWMDAAHTQQAASFPGASDTAHILATVKAPGASVLFGTSHAGLTIIYPGALFHGARCDHDVQITNMQDWYRGNPKYYDSQYFQRMRIGGTSQFVGPNRNFFQYGNSNLESPQSWSLGHVPTPTEIAVFSGVQDDLGSVTGNLNAGLVFNAIENDPANYSAPGYYWFENQATFVNSTITCQGMFDVLNEPSNVIVNGNYCAFGVNAITSAPGITINGDSHLNFRGNGWYYYYPGYGVGDQQISIDPLAMVCNGSLSTVNAGQRQGTDGIVSIIARTLQKHPVSLDSGITWMQPLPNFAPVDPTNLREGIDRGDGVLGLLKVPAANQVLSGVGFDVSSTGNVTLPTASQVLSIATFGPGSSLTGTVTLPVSAQVLLGVHFGPESATSGAYQPVSPSDVRSGKPVGVSPQVGTAAMPLPSQVLNGVAVDNTVGVVTLPTAAQVLNTVAFGANNGTTGTVGLPSTSQVVAGVSFGPGNATAGTVTLPAASQVLSGVGFGPGGTSSGNVILPSASQVLSTATFGPNNGTSGTVGLPTASQVIAGVSFGPGSSTSGTVSLPTSEQVITGATFGPGGSLSGAYQTVSANNVRSGTPVGVSPQVGSLAVPGAASVLQGVAVDATTGTYVAPTASQVINTATFGPSASIAGNVALPSVSAVVQGVTFGPDNSLTGSYVCAAGTYAAVSDVRYGIDRGDGQIGTCHVPPEENVRQGVPTDVSGIGKIRIPLSSQVLSGVGFDVSSTGTYVASYASVSDVRYGVNRGDGQTGTCHVPGVMDVRNGVLVDVPPTRGELIVPANTDVRKGVAVDSGIGQVNVPLPSQVLDGVAVDRAVGTVGLPAASQVITGVNFGPGNATSGTVVLPGAAQVLNTETFGPNNSTLGTVGLPISSQVLADVGFGPGNTIIGNVGLPLDIQVESGVQFGPNNSITGTLKPGGGATCDYPSANDVRHGVQFGDNETGLVHVPLPSQVQEGVPVDVDGVGELATGSGTCGLTDDERDALMLIKSRALLIGTSMGVVHSPMNLEGSRITLIRGDDYTIIANQILEWADPGNWPVLSASDVSIELKIGTLGGKTIVTVPGEIIDGSDPQIVQVQPTRMETTQIIPSLPFNSRFQLLAIFNDSPNTVRTLAIGLVDVVDNLQ